MSSYVEGVLKRYVIATIGEPTMYLIFKNDNISFTRCISAATKTTGASTANIIKNEFYAYTKRTDIDLAVIPVRITYELLQDQNEGDDIGLLS